MTNVDLRDYGIIHWQHALAMINWDSRVLEPIILDLVKNDDWETLAHILKIALQFNHLDVVWQIHTWGMNLDREELMVENFEDWFTNGGCLWFNLCHDATENIHFICEEDQRMLQAIFHTYEFPTDFWQNAFNLAETKKLSTNRLSLILCLAGNREPKVTSNEPIDIDGKFRDYCRINKLTILRQWQEHQRDIRFCSAVYLVIDNDGIAKIFKQLLNYNEDSRCGDIFDREDRIYQYIEDLPFVPRYLGQVEIETDLVFMKFEFIYGQSLADFIRQSPLNNNIVQPIMHRLIYNLHQLHQHNVLHLDLRPENIIVTENEVYIIDFGTARCYNGEVDYDYIHHPMYTAPEFANEYTINPDIDWYAVGVIWYILLTGKHHFTKRQIIHRPLTSDSLILQACETLIHEITSYDWRRIEKLEIDDTDQLLLGNFLSYNPLDRTPMITLPFEKVIFKFVPRAQSCVKEFNTVLFPARMGIPHRGHIEYISRLIQLGYHVRISLQRSYTITDKDPIPKWLVAKMIAQSLFNLGFSTNHFSITLTPFYENQEQMHLHFSMMPQAENFVAMASSNPVAAERIAHQLLLPQKAIFGQTGFDYEDRSWGQRLRQAVKDNDRTTFDELAASGIEKILTFEEMRATYAQPEIEFVPGSVRLVVENDKNEILFQCRMPRYGLPESVIINQWQMQTGNKAVPTDLFAKNTELLIKDKHHQLIYDHLIFDGTNETLYYKLKTL